MDAQLNSTIVIALITFASGAFGAVIGAFGAVYAAKVTALTRSAREQMLDAMQQDLLNVPEIRIRKAGALSRSVHRQCKEKSTSQQRQSSR